MPFQLWFLVVCCLSGAAVQAGEAETKKVLMVGNSLTYTYSVPTVLKALAADHGRKLDIVQHTTGGKSLAWHLTNPSAPDKTTAMQAIAQGGWDLVILQDHSQMAFKAEETAAFQKASRELVAACGKTPAMFYTGFVRKADVDEASARKVHEVYARQADALGIACAPVALAFLKVRQANANLALIDNQKGLTYAQDKTGTHQSPFGTYVAACTIYAAIYDQSPVGSKVFTSGDGTAIAPADATLAQQAAWDTWTAYKATRKPAQAAAGN